MKQGAAVVNRRHNQPVGGQDFSFVHFNKESLVVSQERDVDVMEDIYHKGFVPVSHTIPGPRQQSG
jgi:hypothetical protein